MVLQINALIKFKLSSFVLNYTNSQMNVQVYYKRFKMIKAIFVRMTKRIMIIKEDN